MKNIYIFLVAVLLSQTALAQNISGPQYVCSGTSYNYTNYNEVPYTSVKWYKDGTYLGTGNSKSISFSGSSTVSVKVYNGSSMVGQDDLSVIMYSPGGIQMTAGNGCYNTSITLNNYWRVGTVTWYARPSGGSWVNYGGAANINYTITSNTEFKVVSSSCGSAVYYNVNVNMPLTSAGTISNSGATAICTGATPSRLNRATMPSGFEISAQWESSTNGSSWTAIPGAIWGGYYDPSPLYQSTYFRLRYYGCSSSSLVTNQLLINVYQPSVAGTLGTSGAWTICNSGNVNLTLIGSTGTSYEWKKREKLEGGSWSDWSTINTTGSPSLSYAISTNSTQYKDYEFQAFVTNGVCGTVVSNIITGVKAFPYAQGGNTTIGGSTSTVYGYGSVGGTLGATGHIGTIYNYEMKQDGTWTTKYGSGFSVFSSTYFRAIIQSGPCTEATSQQIFVKIYETPTITAISDVVSVGGILKLELTANYYSYQWIKDDVDIIGADEESYTATEPGVYKVRVQGSAEAPPYTSIAFTVNTSQVGLSQVLNYKVITHYAKEGFTVPTNPYTFKSDEVAQTVEYHDGFGRSIQSVIVAKSPNQNDIVQPFVYDAYGMQTVKYLPYVSTYSSGAFQAAAVVEEAYNASLQYDFYQIGSGVASDNQPYSKIVAEPSPLNRSMEIGAPGSAWQPGTGHTIRNNYLVNTSTVTHLANVKTWSEAGPGINYVDQALMVVETTDENSNRTWAFTDKLNRTILKRVELNEAIDGANVSFLDTYYVYDKRGNLIMQIPPKASAKLAAGTSWSTTFRDEWCFVYTYDDFNRLIEKKVPSATSTYYVYDPLDRMVLMQDGNLRTTNKWLFTKYDINGRIAMLGTYTNSTRTTRADIQLNVADALYANTNDPYFEFRGTSLEGYTNQSFPTTNSDSSPLEILSVNYYDNYDFDNTNGNDFSYTPQSLAGEGTSVTDVFGLPTGSKRKILNTSSWLIQYVFYDKWNRAIQIRSNNQLSSTIDDLITNVYDFQGRLRLTKKFHDSSVANSVTTVTRNEYDFAGRVLHTFQSIGVSPEVLAVSYKYNKLGQVIEKNLHCTDCSDPGLSQDGTVMASMINRNVYNSNEKILLANQSITLSPGFEVASGDTFEARIAQPSTPPTDNSVYQQSVDYRYNIRGWLTSINNAKLNNDGDKNNDTNDYFGMEFTYNQSEGGSFSNTPFYNGNISAVKWKAAYDAAGDAGQRSYKLDYDKSNKLKSATYRKNSATGWDQDNNTLNETMKYDHNGNILKMERNTIQRTLQTNFTLTTAADVMDDLTYSYAAGAGNQLSQVEDAGSNDGFVNGDTQTTEYTYDNNGSLTADKNKDIQKIEYNLLGKPSRMEYPDGRVVTYNYDGAGNKLSMSVFNGATLVSNTDYVGGYVYENGNLAYFGSPEGRVVKKGDSYNYQYAITDHQGSTRILFATDAGEPDTYKATFEDDTQTEEVAEFQNYPTGGGWRNSTNMWDHTDTGTTYTHSQLLNGASGGQVGLAKAFKVYPGDVIEAKVYAKYLNVEGSNTNLTGLGAALTGAFGLTAGGSGEAIKAFTALNDYSSVMLAAGGNGDPQAPKAFITMLLFDNNFNFVDLAYEQIDAGATTYHDLMAIEPKTIEEPGYAYIYISNENPKMIDVYFDDMEITHTKTPVLQYNEYYPFGLQTSQSWTRENTTNNYLYNGGTEQNPTTGFYDLAFRNYDPVLGRMAQVDPMADAYGSWTPYKYGLNDPMYWSDPSGASEGDPNRNVNGGGSFQRADDDFRNLNTLGSDMYGDGIYSAPGRFGPGYKPGEYEGSARMAQQGLVAEWLIKYVEYSDGVTRTLSTTFIGFQQQQTQDGPPTIFVNMYATPKGFDVDGYLTGLKSALVANGFSKDLVVERSSISGSLKAWWNSSPTASVTIKNFRLGQDRLEAGGYATLNDPHSMIIYNGLSATGAGTSVAMWMYINATVHEIGHGVFGFDHDSSGMTSDPSSIMDYRSAYTKGAGFNGAQQVIIMESIWGR